MHVDTHDIVSMHYRELFAKHLLLTLAPQFVNCHMIVILMTLFIGVGRC